MNAHTPALLLATLLAVETGAADSLSVTTSVANAMVRPAVNGQIRMPALEIETTIRGVCREGSEPVSLSLASADAIQRVSLDTVDTDGAWHTTFSLPASQVPPLVARGFCLADAPDAEAPAKMAPRDQFFAVRKEAFLSLRASFRCSDGENERLTTQTTLVDVDLVCEADAATQESSE